MKRLLRGILAIVFLSIGCFQPANSSSIFAANPAALAPVVATAISISPGHNLSGALVASIGNLVQPTIVDHSPPSNGLDVDRTATISVTFDSDMDPGSINASTFVVNGAISGRHSGLIEYDAPSRTAEFTPQTPFAVGEVVSVTITTGIQSGGAESLDSAYVWQFFARAEGGTGKFDLGHAIPWPGSPLCAAVGDFNDDDYPDVVTADYDSSRISVFFNNGDSTLTLSATYPAGTRTIGACVGDFNADGSLDIAAVGNVSNDMFVFFNNGDGTFTAQAPVAAGTAPRSLVPIDVEGDGDLDLAVANTASKDIGIFLNDGAGLFTLDSLYPIAATLFYISSADLNNDGRQDLVIVGSNTNQAYAILNKGDGTFADPVAYATANHPRGTSTADYDGDGFADIATADDHSYVISVFINNEDGTFGDNNIYSTGADGPFLHVNGDVDADGDIDIVTSNGGYGSASIMINSGDGSFTLDYGYQISVTNDYGIATADMDGDGDLDVVMSAINPSKIQIIFNRDRQAVDSTSPRSEATSVLLTDSIVVFFGIPFVQSSINDSTFVVRSRATGKISGTIDYGGSNVAVFKPDQPFLPGDEISVVVSDAIDVISSDQIDKSYSWTFSTAVTGGIGAFQPARQLAVDFYPRSLCAADLNNDGLLDLAVPSSSRNLITLLLNNGDSTFTFDTAGLVERIPYDIAAADLDGDDDLDLITACLGDSSVVICYNDGTGHCGSTARFAEGVKTSSLAIADFNRDGHPDIAAAKVYSKRIYVYFNDGQGGFSAPGVPCDLRYMPYSLATADFDSDGDADLTASIFLDSNYVTVMYNNGYGEFYQQDIMSTYPPDSGTFQDSTHSVYAGDLNNDGFADLVVGNVRINNISVMLNDRFGNFESPVIYDVTARPHSIFGGDFDGDGDIDLVTADQTIPGYVTVMENLGDGTFGDQWDYPVGDSTHAVIGADIDGDGDMDILAANGDSHNISLLLDRDTAYVESLPIADTIPQGDSCLMQVKVTGDPDDVVLHYRLGGETIWTDTVLQSSDTVYQCKIATDATDLRSTGYYFEVNQLEVTKTLPAVAAATKPNYIRNELTDVLTRDLQDSVYLIIGFPFDVDPADPAGVFEDDFETYDVLRWRLGRWDPDIPGYVEYPALDSIRRGDGYWLHNRTGAHLDASGYSALPDTVINDTAYARLDLRPGWNQIATPFDFPVSWNHRRLNNDIDVLLNAYAATDTGSYYYSTDTLLPFHGYFLYSNATETTPLFLPYIRANLLPTVTLLPLAPRHDFWQAQIGLESDGAADVTNTFGVRPQATAGRDKFDSHEPPLPPGKYVSLCFEQTADGGNAELLNGDFREPGRGWMFNLLVRGNTGAAARMRLTDTLLFPSEYNVVLVDTVTGVRYPISRTGTLHLPRVPSIEGVRYRLLVGDEAYIDAHSGSDAAIPERFCLYQNHPNPFNPATTIRFDLPAAAHARLDVFNILGQRVTTLLDADMPAGSHAVRWDGHDGNGRSVASGVYFYRLSAGTETAKRKMILVK